MRTYSAAYDGFGHRARRGRRSKGSGATTRQQCQGGRGSASPPTTPSSTHLVEPRLYSVLPLLVEVSVGDDVVVLHHVTVIPRGSSAARGVRRRRHKLRATTRARQPSAMAQPPAHGSTSRAVCRQERARWRTALPQSHAVVSWAHGMPTGTLPRHTSVSHQQLAAHPTDGPDTVPAASSEPHSRRRLPILASPPLRITPKSWYASSTLATTHPGLAFCVVCRLCVVTVVCAFAVVRWDGAPLTSTRPCPEFRRTLV